MNRKLGFAAAVVAVVALALTHKQLSRLWAADEGARARILITEPIDEAKLITLRGNTRPEAKVAEYDRGRVEDSFPMEYMLLQLKRPPELEQAFEQDIDSLTDKSSPNFHHWLTADEQGQQYGLAQEDLHAITGWLRSHGFTIDLVYPNTMVIAFSGTGGDILEAFHTEIHYLDVRGESHFANVSDPQIPEALAPAVVGVVSMHNFQPQAMNRRAEYSFGGCSTLPTQPGTCYALVPADFQTIYNVTPLFRLGILGQGQTIAVVESSDTYTPSGGTNDVTVYRNTFLSKYSGTVTTTHPGGCTDPGTNSADSEADLDAEVASAIAPDATIEVAACANTTTFGGLIAVENLVSAGSPPSIISMSYGECEAANGASSNASFNSAFQSAAAAGVSVFVASGDAGASGCAPLFFTTTPSYYAYPGVGVTGWGESVYNVSVGGTDFEDVYNAKETSTTLSTYWNISSSNSATDGSAKSYIPEIPWNDSCASWLIANFEGLTPTYGSAGFCNNSTATTSNHYLSTDAGGGGPSGCATGGGANPDQTHYAVVDGTCTGYAKPSWQSGILGNPADGVRDIPDVSLFAANGSWGHFAIICFSDTGNGGTACPAGNPSAWSGFGGTSVATPMMAAIQALVNQKWGNLWQGSWLTSHSYALNALITDSNGNVEQVTTAGTSGSSAPTWNPSLGGTTTDNTVTWTNRGKGGTWQANRAYALNAIITDSNGDEEQVTTAGTSGTTAPGWNTTLGGTTTDNTVTWTNRGAPAASRSGNPNPIYYKIAKAEFGSRGNSACYSINQPARRGLGSSCVFYDITQGDNDVDCIYNGTGDAAGAGCYLPSGTYGALSTQALTTGTVTAGGSGYTSAPNCALGAPSNLNQYLDPSGEIIIWGGGAQAACTASYSTSTHVVTSVTVSVGGQGYAGGTSCTISNGGGSGATCSASPVMGTIAGAYQPAYGATPGWDFATGLGSVNAYNLVFNTGW